MEEEKVTQEVAPAPKPLTKREIKRQKKLADKKFEQEAGMKPLKVMALVFGIVGFSVSFISIALVVVTGIFALLCYLATAILAIFAIFGLLCFGLGYIIYAATNENPSLDGYFAIVTVPSDFATNLMEKVLSINGIFTVICASIGIVFEIVAFIMICITIGAFTPKHRTRNFILISLALIISILVLAWGITKL